MFTSKEIFPGISDIYINNILKKDLRNKELILSGYPKKYNFAPKF